MIGITCLVKNHRTQDYIDAIEEFGRLSEIVNEEQAKVISSHQQAVKEVGEGFVVSACTEAGIIEAIEIPSRRFVIGVQYHPERMLKTPELREHAKKLFQAFINAASHTAELSNQI